MSTSRISAHPKNSSIDIRGMGATAPNNVLVLVDGQRLNENDLTGADLSTIPMSQIERIEILRGGGAVRYGNGAVAGVVNIITKKPVPGGWRLDLLGRLRILRDDRFAAQRQPWLRFLHRRSQSQQVRHRRIS